jgi:4-hydroxy-tetrahydrodipicolinate synthase
MTPFHPETEAIDYEALAFSLERIHHAGGRVFYAMAYNSRYSLLTFEEIRELNSFVVRHVKSLSKEHVVIVGDPPHCSTQTTIEFARNALEVGADLISLIVRERYYSDEQIYRHFEMVANSVPINLLIHEMPFLNGFGGPSVNWPVELLNRLADIPTVAAIKEDAKDDEYSDAVIRTISDRLSIIISGGDQSQWLRFVEKGCQSWLIGVGVFEPRLAVAFYRAWQNRDKDWCDAMINEIERPFFEHGVSRFGWHLTIKAALEALGVMSRHDRMPLMPLGKSEAEEVRRLIDRMPIERYATYSASTG